MSIMQVPFRVVQISDVHCGTPTFDASLMERCVRDVNSLLPDVVIIAGDITSGGYQWEYEDAAEWFERFEAPTVVVPGNHDARNLGYLHFERFFGDRHFRRRMTFDPDRAERINATGVTIVGLDSSEPDLNDGRIGREWYDWIGEQYVEPDDIKILVLHHHLVSIPGTGRERNTISDAGDVLDVLTRLQLDLVMCGHKHVPFFWGLNGMLICNSGTTSTRRVRGLTPPSWNEITIDAATIKVHLHYDDGRRELSVIRSRANRSAIRESFYVTDDFRADNRVDAVPAG
ncbi:MAG: metallophosphoesterase [Actinobacteria bacterium]|nr:metallophosphoesterase [Actinomycetota bacterium]